MAIKHILLFVETPRKIITAKLSIRKPGSSSVLIIFSGCLLTVGFDHFAVCIFRSFSD
jgi:hypothetical protein